MTFFGWSTAGDESCLGTDSFGIRAQMGEAWEWFVGTF
jgi:hypothetical protein